MRGWVTVHGGLSRLQGGQVHVFGQRLAARATSAGRKMDQSPGGCVNAGGTDDFPRWSLPFDGSIPENRRCCASNRRTAVPRGAATIGHMAVGWLHSHPLQPLIAWMAIDGNSRLRAGGAGRRFACPGVRESSCCLRNTDDFANPPNRDGRGHLREIVGATRRVVRQMWSVG